ncbi:MAG: type II secretion system protein GspM [Nitrospirota bacterium]
MRARLSAWWRERTGRERLVLGGGAAAVLVLAVYGLAVDPLLERNALLDRRIANRQEDFDRVSKLSAEYRVAADQVAILDQRVSTTPGSFALLSFLEESATAQQIRNRLASIRPQPAQTSAPYREVTAEVKLEAITLPQIVAYLEALDRAPQRLRIKSLRLKTRYADPKLLDGSFVVSTYERVS